MKTVAIVGNGRSRVDAPHNDYRMAVWTMNNHAMLWDRRTTSVFEMHPDALTAERYDDEYKNWLRQPHEFPIYMHEPNPDIPASVRFPHKEINYFYKTNVEKGNKSITDFFTTTPPYMLALALYLDFRRVELYGIDLENEERQAHRDSVFYWMGILRGRGVELYIPEKCGLMDEALYPITTPLPIQKRRKS